MLGLEKRIQVGPKLNKTIKFSFYHKTLLATYSGLFWQ